MESDFSTLSKFLQAVFNDIKKPLMNDPAYETAAMHFLPIRWPLKDKCYSGMQGYNFLLSYNEISELQPEEVIAAASLPFVFSKANTISYFAASFASVVHMVVLRRLYLLSNGKAVGALGILVKMHSRD